MPPSTLIELLEHQAKARGEQLAFSFELDESQTISWTYAELDRRARAVAALLQQSTAAGDRVVLLFPPGLDYIAAFFGCLYAGVLAVPACYPKFNRPIPRLSAIVKDCQAKAVLTNSQTLEQFRQGGIPGPELQNLQWVSVENLPAGAEDTWKSPEITADNLAFLQYTSGSTSDPKGVMVSHGNLIHNLQTIDHGFGIGSHGQGVFWLPAYHDMGLIGGILMPIYVGRPAALMSPTAFLQRPVRWLQAIMRERATISGAPNFAYDLCVDKITPEQLGQLDLSSWEVAFCGAEPIRRETLERFAATFAPCGFRREAFYPCFGLAEATLLVSGGLGPSAPHSQRVTRAGLEQNVVEPTESGEGSTDIVACGQTFDQKVLIVDPQKLSPCAGTEIGEIWVAGPSVTKGYWNRPDETARTFGARLADSDEGPFLRTGDLGFMHDGELFIAGRLKDLIVLRGRNHYPQDIEHSVEASHTGLRRGAGAAFTVDSDGQTRLVILQEVERHYRKSSLGAAIAEIRSAVAREHEIQPHAVVLVRTMSLPKTSSGKIKRHACRSDYLRGKLDVLARWSQDDVTGPESNGHDKKHRNGKLHGIDPGAKPPVTGVKKPRRSFVEIRNWLITQVAKHLGSGEREVDPNEPLERYGLDSLVAVSLSGDLEEWLGVRVQPTIVYEYPTIEAIARHFSGGATTAESADLIIPETSLFEPIAIIGMGCRFPGGANDPESYWQILRDGVFAIRQVPPDRWNIDEFYDPDPQAPGKMSTRWGGFLDQVDQFDPFFFGISPREANVMDPQQRLFLEVAWEALENAGRAPDKLGGTATGVFAAVCTHDYSQIFHRLGSLDHIDPYFGTGNAFSVTSGRLSHILGIQGPSVVVDTACSSSLVSVHLACQSLRTGECRMALAGGVTLMLSPTATINFSKAHMMASDGRCKTFDAAADGYVRGEGCGIVVLKRLADALADGDRVLAVIRGSAVNHDGHSNGLTAPNGQAQEAVIRQALALGGVDPSEVGYLEAHGTGTSLGDPVEVRAIGAAFGAQRSEKDRLIIASVKTNIGHLEAAAGIAGLIKTVLVLKNGEIPPHLHFKKINPYIPLDEIPVRIPTERTPWPANSRKRIAGVSAYAFSGTNAHIVLEEAPAQEAVKREVDRPLHLLTMSAKSESALRRMADRYRQQLASGTVSLADLCFSANTGRAHHAYRLAVVAEDAAQAASRLQEHLDGQRAAGVFAGRLEGARRPKIAFLFTGQGAQYAGMGRELYDTQPIFRRALDECAKILAPYIDRPLLDVLYPAEGDASPLDQTAYTQPALFALEYALAQLWLSWGVQPAAVLGHSVGEYAAACIAGVFSLEDGLKLIAERARLMQELPAGGRMAAVFADLDRVKRAVEPFAERVTVATINAPENIVVSGEGTAVQEVLEQLSADDIRFQPLNVSHAFHSPLMEPILERFEQVAAEITYSAPQIPLISNLTGGVAEERSLSSPSYWRRHLREAVRFSAGVETLQEQGITAYVEIGPAPTLLSLAQRSIGREAGVWLPSLRRGTSDWRTLLESLATLYTGGTKVEWSAFDHGYDRSRVSVPAYPYERERYWMQLPEHRATHSSASGSRAASRSMTDSAHVLLGARLRSPLKDQLFESQPTTAAVPYLRDHQVYGTVVLPATAYLEMALAAARSVSKSADGAAITLEHVRLKKPLLLSDGEAPLVQLVLSPDKSEASAFQITSLVDSESESGDDSAWTLHAKGRIRVDRDTHGARSAVSLAELEARCTEQIPVGLFYQRMEILGLNYGPAFQGIRFLRRGGGESLGDLRLGESESAEGYVLHPALLDGCFQLMGAALPSGDLGEGVFVPVGLEKLQVFRPAGPSVRCHARLRKDGDSRTKSMIKGDLTLLDDNGQVVAEVTGLWLARAMPEQLVGKPRLRTDDWLYELDWQPQDRQNQHTNKNGAAAGNWLVLCDENGIGPALAEQLELRGERCIFVRPGAAFETRGIADYAVNPTNPADFERLLSNILATHRSGLNGIVHMWNVDSPHPLNGNLAAAVERGCAGLLHVVQAAAARIRSGTKPRLWVITRGAQAVSAEAVAIEQTPVVGLGRVVSLEHADLRCTLLDLDPSESEDGQLESLLGEIWSGDRPDQIAYRSGQRYVARIVRQGDTKAKGSAKVDGPVRLEIPKRGQLDNITLRPATRRAPGRGEVEIEVFATGLNFRDVLNVLGLYPGDPGPLGGECSGRVSAVGEGVEHLAVGDEVLGIASGSFSTYVTTPAAVVARKPADMSFEEAATVPITFLTAHYGLTRLANMKPGDRVLIHAASGGVGLAAIQLAQRAGAEVFGTAGNTQKWDYLRSLGVRHVMNSRTLDFADQVQELTGGAGVDIVLNSLAGDFIPKSLSVLAPGGRFLEIGKADIWDDARVAEVKQDVSYFAIALDQMVLETPELVGEMLRELMPLFESGELKPLPHRVFPLSSAVDAFRFMAQAKHIGKIVVAAPRTQDSADRVQNGQGTQHLNGESNGSAKQLVPHSVKAEEPSRVAGGIRSDATYLISGGLGALGLHIARHLALQGARHLALTSRRRPGEEALRKIEELEQTGVSVRVVAADVGKREDVQRLLAEINDLPPLAGIVHAAGVLDDGVLTKQTWERFQKVFSPKLDGAWNLHVLTEQMPLDFFVMFSSVASLLGSPGQGNYAAANAFLDGLAHRRRAMGLPGLSINWGPWADGGMATSTQQRGTRQIGGGLEMIPAAQGVQLFEKLLQQNRVQAAVLNVDWKAWCQANPKLGKLPLLSAMTEDLKSDRPASRHRQQILSVHARDRYSAIESYLREQVAHIMQIPTSRLEVQLPLANLGLDSLMAVELKNIVEADLDIEIPTATLIEGPSIAQLAEELTRQLGDQTETQPVKQATNGRTTATSVQSKWLASYRPQPNPDLRLFCFHYLGGGASAFRGWQEELPSGIEVCPVQLPGREGRLREPAIDQMDTLIDALAEAVHPLCDRPFAIYGHSMGSIVGFELARRLRSEYGLSPVHFIVGGYYAPEMRSRYQTKRHWEEHEIVERARTLLEAPEEILSNTEFMRALAPTIKADLSLLGGYVYSPGQLLECPITAIGGHADGEVRETDLAAWQNYTTGKFDLEMTPGSHLFLLNNRTELIEKVAVRLERYLRPQAVLTSPVLHAMPLPG